MHIPYHGQEDWELWLRVLDSSYKFHYLNEVTFDYRVSSSSLIRSYDKKMRKANESYIKKKHSELYIKFYRQIYDRYKRLEKINNQSLFKRTINCLKNKKL